MAIDPLPPAPALAQLYTDDVVADRDDPTRIGVITRTAWEQDEDGGDDDDDNDDEQRGEDDERDEREEPERLPAEHARILWLPGVAPPTAVEDAPSPSAASLSAVHSAARLSLVDRSLLQGDVVVRASDPLGLMGCVVDVSIALTLRRMADGSVVADVPSTAVQPVHPFPAGVHVTKDDGRLLGWVDDCVCDVHVRFADRSECVIRRVRNRDLQDLAWDAREEEEDEDDEADGPERKSKLWYPGQRVRGRPAVWRAADWIRGNRQSALAAAHEGVITEVVPATVRVEWLSGVDHVEDVRSDCRPEELRVLSVFEASRIMLGDHVLLSAAPQPGEAKESAAGHAEEQSSVGADDGEDAAEDDDSAPSTAPLSKAAKRRLRVQRAAARRRQSDDALTRSAQVVRTLTCVSVLWQNGVVEERIPSITLLPRTDLVDNDFLPNDFVLVRGSQRLATILSVEPAQRTCTVQFLPIIADDVVRPGADEDESEGGESVDRSVGERCSVSIFDCVAHPRLELSVSSLVVRIPGAGDADTDAPDVAYGTAGQVLALSEGRITVRWADPALSCTTVQADQVWNVDQPDDAVDGDEEDEDYDNGDGAEDDVDGEAAWEEDRYGSHEEEDDGLNDDERAARDFVMDTIQQLSGDGGHQQHARRGGATIEEIRPGEEDDDDDGEDGEDEDGVDDDDEANGGNHRAELVVGADSGGEQSSAAPSTGVASVLGSSALFSRLFGSSQQPPAAAQPPPQPSTDTPAAVGPTTTPASVPGAASAGGADDDDDDDNSSLDLSTLLSRPPVSASSCSSFSVLPRPSSAHYFLSSYPSPSTSSAFVRKARSEHRLLSAHLPAGIHVLTYESRLDLLRCAIAGPATTPYFASLFLFDIVLPPTYPSVPPLLHFHARGLRINPNLYAEGKVCLSLLGTWNGRGNERWSQDSTLLQVLLSLQGLVLGETEPFFLEAGFERLRSAAHVAVASVQYSETALLLTLSLTAGQLSQPDPEWEPLLQSHFASPEIVRVFADLHDAAAELSAGAPLTDERTAQVRAAFQRFSIPMGKLLGEATPLSQPGGATAGARDESKSAEHTSAAAALAAAADEEKSSAPSAAVSASSSTSSVPYVPSSGFLSALTRNLARLQAAIAKNRAQWPGPHPAAT